MRRSLSDVRLCVGRNVFVCVCLAYLTGLQRPTEEGLRQHIALKYLCIYVCSMLCVFLYVRAGRWRQLHGSSSSYDSASPEASNTSCVQSGAASTPRLLHLSPHTFPQHPPAPTTPPQSQQTPQRSITTTLSPLLHRTWRQAALTTTIPVQVTWSAGPSAPSVSLHCVGWPPF